jgi:hypothetical protein
MASSGMTLLRVPAWDAADGQNGGVAGRDLAGGAEDGADPYLRGPFVMDRFAAVLISETWEKA